MDYKLNVVLDKKQIRKEPIKLILPNISNNPNDKSKSFKNKSLPNKEKIGIKSENNSKNNKYHIYKSRNNNIYNCNTLQTKAKKRYESYDNNTNNYNIFRTNSKKKYESFNNNINNNNAIQTKLKRYESVSSTGQNITLNVEAKLFNNRLNNHDNSLENYHRHSNNNIWEHNYKKFISPVYNNVKSIDITDLNDGEPDKMISEISKIKSTNFIIHLNKNKKKKGAKISLFNKNNHNNDEDDEDNSFSSKSD